MNRYSRPRVIGLGGLVLSFVGTVVVGITGYGGLVAGFGGPIVWASNSWRIACLLGWSLLAVGFVLQFIGNIGRDAATGTATRTGTFATMMRWRYYFGWPLPTDAAALERLAERLSVSMSGTAVTAAGHTGTDTALVQQRIRDAIRGQRGAGSGSSPSLPPLSRSPAHFQVGEPSGSARGPWS